MSSRDVAPSPEPITCQGVGPLRSPSALGELIRSGAPTSASDRRHGGGRRRLHFLKPGRSSQAPIPTLLATGVVCD
jgi:hypothetical protein